MNFRCTLPLLLVTFGSLTMRSVQTKLVPVLVHAVAGAVSTQVNMKWYAWYDRVVCKPWFDRQRTLRRQKAVAEKRWL